MEMMARFADLAENPDYKKPYREFIRLQIHIWVQQLAGVGEESFIMSATVDAESPHVFGSAKGLDYMQEFVGVQKGFIPFLQREQPKMTSSQKCAKTTTINRTSVELSRTPTISSMTPSMNRLTFSTSNTATAVDSLLTKQHSSSGSSGTKKKTSLTSAEWISSAKNKIHLQQKKACYQNVENFSRQSPSLIESSDKRRGEWTPTNFQETSHGNLQTRSFLVCSDETTDTSDSMMSDVSEGVDDNPPIKNIMKNTQITDKRVDMGQTGNNFSHKISSIDNASTALDRIKIEQLTEDNSVEILSNPASIASESVTGDLAETSTVQNELDEDIAKMDSDQNYNDSEYSEAADKEVGSPINVESGKDRAKDLRRLCALSIPGQDERCPISGCGQTYLNKTSLQKHMLVNHPDARPFCCNECTKTYKREKGLKKHMQYHRKLRDIPVGKPTNSTKGFKNRSEKKDCVCEYCKKSFSCNQSLNRHKTSCKMFPRGKSDLKGLNLQMLVNQGTVQDKVKTNEDLSFALHHLKDNKESVSDFIDLDSSNENSVNNNDQVNIKYNESKSHGVAINEDSLPDL